MNPKDLQKFEEFLSDFVRELNQISEEERGVVLVEGKRDALALRNIGYSGKMVTIASMKHRTTQALLKGAKTIVILTDLDREGRQLAARYMKLLLHAGIESSLDYRKRLLVASRGAFLHIENLNRFSHIRREGSYQD